MSEDEPTAWYAFWSEEEKREYFYDPRTQTTSWSIPDAIRAAATPNTCIMDENDVEGSPLKSKLLSNTSWEHLDDVEHSEKLNSKAERSWFSTFILLSILFLVWIEAISVTTPAVVSDLLSSLGLIKETPSDIPAENMAVETDDFANSSERMARAIHTVTFTGASILQRLEEEMKSAGYPFDGPVATSSAVELFDNTKASYRKIEGPHPPTSMRVFQKPEKEEDPCKKPLSFLFKPKCRTLNMFDAQDMRDNMADWN
jgi:hypothetical protein